MRTTAAVATRMRATEPSDVSHLEAFRSARFRSMLTPLLVLCILALPLLIPRGPENTAPPDLVMIPFTALGAAALWRMRSRVRFPLGAFYLMIVLGGIIATTNSIVPQTSATAIIQDGYLFLWFIVALNFMRDGSGRSARLAAKTWVFAGVAIALLTSFLRFTPYVERPPRLFGFALVSSFGRTSATFEDPNLAGNYLAVSLFVMWASPWPATRKVKLALSVPFLVGVWATDSITALACVLGGTFVTILTGNVARSVRVAGGIALVGVTLFGLTFLPSDLGIRSQRLTQTVGRTTAFAGSLGRTDRSLAPRLQRIQDTLRFVGSDILIGIGPAATAPMLLKARAPIGGEIHSDYAGGFVERGIVGGIGVLGLLGGMFWWAIRAGVNRRLRADGWRPAALTGATTAVLLAGFSLEALHFRHVWALFALTIALAIGATERPAARPAANV